MAVLQSKLAKACRALNLKRINTTYYENDHLPTRFDLDIIPGRLQRRTAKRCFILSPANICDQDVLITHKFGFGYFYGSSVHRFYCSAVLNVNKKVKNCFKQAGTEEP